MHSTRQLLTIQFSPGTGSNAERHKNLEFVLRKYIEMPEHYLDQILETPMDRPVDTKLIDHADPYFMDLDTKKKLDRHPLTLEPFPRRYEIDYSLARRIRVLITLEELKIFVNRTEKKRQESLLEHLTGKPDREVHALLAFFSIDIIEALQHSAENVPDHFFSHAPCHRVMTLPLVLDKTTRVDFFELLDFQPVPGGTTHLSEDEICVHEYINPCTGKPLESIEIDYELLAEIDTFIEKLRLKPQLQTVHAMIAEYDRHVARVRPAFDEKTYLEILENENYPAEKIPESLMLGIIPGSLRTTITTHPVILDGSTVIEFSELLLYWSTKRWGINPATEQPIQTMVYDENLRNDTTNFMLNLEYFAKSIKPEDVKRGNFMRHKNQSWGLSLKKGMFSGHIATSGQNKAAAPVKPAPQKNKQSITIIEDLPFNSNVKPFQ